MNEEERTNLDNALIARREKLAEDAKKAAADTTVRDSNRKDWRISMSEANGYSASKKADMIKKAGFHEDFAKKMLTAVMEEIVKESLLLDSKAYHSLNESYEKEITSSIGKFLESYRIKESFTDPRMIVISNAISSLEPEAEKIFESADEDAAVDQTKKDKDAVTFQDKLMSKSEVGTAIHSLSGDVREKVADLVMKDQIASVADQDALKEINSLNQEKAEADAAEAEQGNIAAEAGANAAIGQADASVAPAAPVAENYNHGIIEALCINEAKAQVANGLRYNSDLALANAIKYVTVLESVGTVGLIDVGDKELASIVSSLGLYAKTNESALTEKLGQRRAALSEKQKKEAEDKAASTKKCFKEAYGQTSKAKTPIKSFAEWRKEQGLDEEVEDKKPADDGVRYVNTINGMSYTTKQLRENLEANGFDFENHDDFETIAESLSYEKRTAKK